MTTVSDKALSLGELLDLELRLYDDSALGPGERRERDLTAARQLRRVVGEPPKALNRPALLRLWLGAVAPSQAQKGASPGAKLDRTLTGTDGALGAAGIFCGGSAAAALLQYDGSHPVNVIYFLAAFVGAQLLTLLLLMAQALPGGVLRPKAGRAPPSLLHRALQHVLHGRLRSAPAFGKIFAPCEAWRLLAFTQLFGVAFNAAALAVTTGTVTFTDIAFSWSTTLDTDADEMHRLVSALATPWAWAAPDAVPSKELVETTQYYRLKSGGAGKYLKPGDVAAYGAWWPFLAACVAFYGLLPRTILLVLARRRFGAARRRIVEGSLELERLADHVNSLLFVDTAAVVLEAAAEPKAAAPKVAGIVLWRDLPFAEAAVTQIVRSATGATAAFVRKAGGTSLDLDGAEAGKALAALAGDRSGAVIVVDVFATLDKALRRFVTGLRAATGPRAPILILPVASGTDGTSPEAPKAGKDDERLSIWRRALRDLGDPSTALAEAP